MASVQTSSYQGRYLKLTVTQKKGSSEQNYSTINWTLESIGGTDKYYTIFNYGVWIDETQRYDGSGLKTKNWDTKKFPAAKGSISGSFIKYHNADGSVNDISFTLYGSVYKSATEKYTGTLSMESIPRYAKVSTYTSDLTETSVKVSWSSDANVDQVQYRLTVDGSTGEWVDVETGVNKSSGSYNISGLIPGKEYKIDYNYKRKDSQLWSFSAGYASSSNITTYDYPNISNAQSFIIGNTIKMKLNNPLGRSCTLYVKGNDDSVICTATKNVNGSIELSSDPSEIAAQYNSIPNSKSGNYKVRLVCSDVSRDTTVNGSTYSIKDNGTEIPNFNNTDWSYLANLTSLTNNNQCIINGYSEITFSINTAATSSYGASISKYQFKWGSKSKYSNESYKVSEGNGNILEVSAIDSRGLIKTTNKTLVSGTTYVPYNIPTLDYSNSYTHRIDGISSETELTLRGNLSVIKFGDSGVNNGIYSAKYKVYDYSNGSWSGLYNIPVNNFNLSSSGYYSLNNFMIHANGSSGGFTVGKRYGIQIILQDANGLLATLTSNLIQITDGKIARDVYQDSNGDYHQGINGIADSNYTEKIYGNEYIEGSLNAASETIRGDSFIQGNQTITGTSTVSGNQTVNGYGIFPKGTQGKILNGGSGTDGYMKAFKITTDTSYQDQSILFDIIQRSRSGKARIILNSSGTAGNVTIYSFTCEGSSNLYYTVADNVLTVYIQKSEDSDNIEVINLRKGNYMNGTTITWLNETVSSLPTGYVTVDKKVGEFQYGVSNTLANDSNLVENSAVYNKVNPMGDFATLDYTRHSQNWPRNWSEIKITGSGSAITRGSSITKSDDGTLKVSSAGVYLVIAEITVNNTSSQLELKIYKNTSTIKAAYHQSTEGWTHITTMVPTTANANDTFEMHLKKGTKGSYEMLNDSTRLTVIRLA